MRLATKAHIAYEVNNLEEWRAKLAAAGTQLLDGVPIPGCNRFEFRDPFGNRVEFIEPELRGSRHS
jgi:catechol 2,3-dioxygenase-like lactoylglutathione lyase family enzyme